MLPTQKVTTAEKNKLDLETNKTWYHKTADYYIDQFQYNAQYEEIIKLRQAVDGIINQADYSYILNPFNVKDTSKLRYGARLRDYNILKGIANLLMGEFGRRTHEYTVTDFNPDDENVYKEYLRRISKQYYSQLAVNKLNELGFDTQKPSEDLPEYKDYVAEFKRTFDQNRAISGQEAIDYIRYEQDLDDKFLDLYWDWIITGRCISFKTTRFDDVDYEHVPPEEYFFPLEDNSPFIEDRSFGIRRRVMQINQVLDTYRGELKSEDLDTLEDRKNSGISSMIPSGTIATGERGFIRLDSVEQGVTDNYFTPNELNYGIEVFHIVWKSFKRVGTLLTIDKLGQEREIEVDDTYTLNKEAGDIKIEWEWISCLEETTRISKDIYVNDREYPFDRTEVNNESKSKLPYNGITTRSADGNIQSIIKQGIPYQLLINGLHFQMEKIINKNKDKITVMPYGLVPRKKGISTKQQMYHADASSILWVDESAPNAQYAAQMIKVLDMSLGQYIKDVIEIMKYIKQEYWDEIGMNPQRYSSIDNGAGKGVTEQAIVQSSIITYELNRRIDKLIEKDYKGLLDHSKGAWIEGIKRKYVRSDGSKAFIDISPDDAIRHLETDYGIFVRNSQEMSEALKGYRNLALTFAQNGGGMGGMAEIFTNNNMEKIKDIVKRIEDNNKAYDEQINEAQREHEKHLEELKQEGNQADRDLKIYEADKQYDAAVDSAEIRANMGSRADKPREDSPTEKQLAEHKIRKENQELDLKRRETINKNNNEKQKQDGK